MILVLHRNINTFDSVCRIYSFWAYCRSFWDIYFWLLRFWLFTLGFYFLLFLTILFFWFRFLLCFMIISRFFPWALNSLRFLNNLYWSFWCYIKMIVPGFWVICFGGFDVCNAWIYCLNLALSYYNEAILSNKGLIAA